MPGVFDPAPWRRAILAGEATFLVGAGISALPPASLPLAAGLIERLVSPILANLPLTPGLSGEVIRAFKRRLRPEVISDVLLEHLGRHALDPLLSILRGRPNTWHYFLASAIGTGCCVVTVNFDNLIEEACHMAGTSFVSIVSPAGLPAASSRSTTKPRSILFKVHGTIGDPPSRSNLSSIALAVKQVGRGLPATEVDTLRTLLIDRPLIVLGYSGHDDFDIQPVLRTMPRPARCLWVIHDSTVPAPRPMSGSALRRSLARPARECAAAWSGPFDLVSGDTSSMIPLLRPTARFGGVVRPARLVAGIATPSPIPRLSSSPGSPSRSALAVLYGLVECRAFVTARRVSHATATHASLPSRDGIRLRVAEAVTLEKDGADFSKAALAAKAAVAMAARINVPFTFALALDQSGVVARRRGRYDDAAAFYRRALRVAVIGRCPRWLVMQIRSHRAVTLEYLAKKRRGAERVRLLRKVLREQETVGAWERGVGDLRGFSKTLNNIGIVHMSLKQWNKGVERLEESIELKTTLGDARGRAQSFHNIGKIEYLRGDYARAEKAFRESLALREGLARDRHGAAQSYVALGRVALTLKKAREARAYARLALAGHCACDDKTGIKQAREILRSLSSRRRRT